MTDPITEINSATRIHFMPVVTNQLFTQSPVLHRIFRIAKEGKFGMALPSFDGRSIAEPLEIGDVSEEAKTHTDGLVTIAQGATTVELGSGTLPTSVANKGYITIVDDDLSSKSYAIASRTDADTLEISTVYEGTGCAGSGTNTHSITYYELTTNASGSYGKTDDWGAGTGNVLGSANFTWKINQRVIRLPKILPETRNPEIGNPDEVNS